MDSLTGECTQHVSWQVIVAELQRLEATLAGRLEIEGSEGTLLAAPSSIRITIAGDPRDVHVAPDLTFAVREVPTGDIEVEIETEGIAGSFTLDEVERGELIEILVRQAPGRLSIEVVRREHQSAPAAF